MPKKLSPTIGVAVDHCPRNRYLEGLQTNVQRLKTYKAKLVVFPQCPKMPLAGSEPEGLATATLQLKSRAHTCLVHERPAVDLSKVTEEMESFYAYPKFVQKGNTYEYHEYHLVEESCRGRE